ncbi:TMEM165/GDT1 family protein [Aerosakkonema funiforme]|uniref:TMEM165/GDT1 family protein n=1 Tax=Oscillatoriophycideae TaxID=1301283 RepID=UPI002AC838C8|nr:TMEM165/GDT1 family protein [Aerosakkonema funiforme]
MPVKLSSASVSLPAFESVSQSLSTLEPASEPKPTDSTEGEPADNTTQIRQAQKVRQGALAVFGSTFLTIFLSEMGDKTQVATLLMSAQSQSPWLVFAGASSALVATSLLGCMVGCWLANRISPQMLKKAAGVSLLFIAIQLFWEVAHY